MANILLADASKCTGCRICEMVCSLEKTGEVRPSDARCRVVREGFEAVAPVVCQHCEDAPCAAACPVGAIRRDAESGRVLLDADECVGCGECIPACPFSAIQRDHEQNVVKCDLCGGDPQCARFCRSGALSLVPAADAPEARRRLTTASTGNPAGKSISGGAT